MHWVLPMLRSAKFSRSWQMTPRLSWSISTPWACMLGCISNLFCRRACGQFVTGSASSGIYCCTESIVEFDFQGNIASRMSNQVSYDFGTGHAAADKVSNRQVSVKGPTQATSELVSDVLLGRATVTENPPSGCACRCTAGELVPF